MKHNLFKISACTALLLITVTSFAQLNVGLGSSTNAATHVNTAAVTNAVNRTTTTTTTVTNNAVNKTMQVQSSAVNRVNNVKPVTSVSVTTSTNTNLSGSGTNTNASTQNDASVSGQVSADNTVNGVNKTKTKVKDAANQTKEKTKATANKVVDKVKSTNANASVSSDVNTQAQISK